jgi:hypothetical protein
MGRASVADVGLTEQACVSLGCCVDDSLNGFARTASALLGRSISTVGGSGLRLLLGTTSTSLGGGGSSFGFVHVFVLFGIGMEIGWQRLARTAPSLLRRRDSSFSFNLGIALFFLDFIVGRKRLARTAPSLLRGDFDFLVVFGGRERLARTAPSLLRSSFGLLFLLSVVVDRSGLLRAASGFLRGSFFFVVSVGGLPATSLLRGGLGRLFIVVLVVGSLGLGRTAAFLASRLLRAAVLSTLGTVSKLRLAIVTSTLLAERTFKAAFSVFVRNMPCLDLPV